MEALHAAAGGWSGAAGPGASPKFERRFETRTGEQAQADFAEFKTGFADEPGVVRKVHPIPFVLRCHVSAFDAWGGATREVLYDP